MAAISSFYPQNLSDEAYKNARGALLQTLSQILKPSQKSFPKPPQTQPKSSQNRAKTVPKPSQIEGNSKCSHKNKKS